MMQSKNTQEIIRELNDFIVKAKETTKAARKGEVAGVPAYAQFWNNVADVTDELAEDLKNMLERITAAGQPDEITNLLNILKAIDSITFKTYTFTLNVKVMIARGTPEHIKLQQHLCDKYQELAEVCSVKARKIAGFFSELTALIFDDMRKTASAKVQTFVKQAKAAAEKASDYPYSHIKGEMEVFIRRLEQAPFENITMAQLDGYAIMLDIISFAVIVDRDENKALAEDLNMLKENFAEVTDYFETVADVKNNYKEKPVDTKVAHAVDDLIFMMNIIMFYVSGELSKMMVGKFLSDEQKSSFDAIFDKMSRCNVSESSDYRQVAEMLFEIHASLEQEAHKLGELGGSIIFLAREFELLAAKVKNAAKDGNKIFGG